MVAIDSYSGDGIKIELYDSGLVKLHDTTNDYICRFFQDDIDDYIDFIEWIKGKYGSHCSIRTNDAIRNYDPEWATHLRETYDGNYIDLSRIEKIKSTLYNISGGLDKIYTREELSSMTIERLHSLLKRKEKKHEKSCSTYHGVS